MPACVFSLRILSFLCTMQLLAACATPYDTIPPPDPGQLRGTGVLVFTKIAGFRHASIREGVAALKNMSEANSWTVIETRNGASFNDQFLNRFEVVVWMSTTWDVLSDDQQAAFEEFIETGGGYVGIHSAADTEYNWAWYGYLIGAWQEGHPLFPNVRNADIIVEDHDHPTTSFLPKRWNRDDEWYSYRVNPRDNPSIRVLASLDESTYAPGDLAMGDHPIIWYQSAGKGRAFYTGIGHTSDTFRDSLALRHLAAAIDWAAGN